MKELNEQDWISLLEEFKYEIKSALSGKSDLSEVQGALNQMQKKLNMFVLKIKEELTKEIKDENTSTMKKVSTLFATEFGAERAKNDERKISWKHSIVNSVARDNEDEYDDKNELLKSLGGKPPRNLEDKKLKFSNSKIGENFTYIEPMTVNFGGSMTDINNQNNVMVNSFDKIRKMLEEKLNMTDFENFLTLNKNSINELQENIMNKINEKDFLSYLASKADVDDINKLFESISDQIEACVKIDDYRNDIIEQASINESLCSENILGRWVWKNGVLTPNCFIPWETQVINTLNNNFIWTKSCQYIQVMTEGYYCIQAAVFPKSFGRTVKVDILINDNLVYQTTAMRTKSAIFNTLPNNIENNNINSEEFSDLMSELHDSNARGASINEVFILSSNSTIALRCSDNGVCEGMISIKRLH